MKTLAAGTICSAKFLPQPAHLASALGNPGVHVVSSPYTILYIEQTAHILLKDCFDSAEGSVGTGFDLRHRAAAKPGTELQVTVELLDCTASNLRFRAEVYQGDRLIMDGHHERAVINIDRLLKNRQSQEATGDVNGAGSWDFWFDVHSPWACLAAHRVGDIARNFGITLRWRALHLPTLIDRIDGLRLLDANSRFRDWYLEDLQDQAALYNISIKYHPQYPLRNSRALRACEYAADQGVGEQFTQRVMRGYWCEEADITNTDMLGQWGAMLGLDASAVQAACADPLYKQRIADNTEEAIGQGVFGVPTVNTGDKLFFGNDRLDFLQHWQLSQL